MMRREESIKKAVVDALCDEPDVDAAEISVRVSGSLVVLTGTVSSPSEREAAYRAAASVSGEIILNNFIVINDNPKEDPRAHIA